MSVAGGVSDLWNANRRRATGIRFECICDDQLVLEHQRNSQRRQSSEVLRQRLLAGQDVRATPRRTVLKDYRLDMPVTLRVKLWCTPIAGFMKRSGLVFTKFRGLWSVRQTFNTHNHDVELLGQPPSRGRGWSGRSWLAESDSRYLVQPFPAGAYVWARRPKATTRLVDGRFEKRQSAIRPAGEKCRVFISDHFSVGYG